MCDIAGGGMGPTEGTGIVGRAEPLRRIAAAMAAAQAGRPSTLLVSGEAGIGKTSVLRSALEAGAAADLVIGWGTCWQGQGAPGFWPWTQALGSLVRSVGPEVALAAVGRDRAILASLVRELGPVSAPSGDGPDQHRLLLLDVTVRWLEALATDRHVVLVLDDLQWADASTFDLLDHLIATPLTARLLVLGAFRHDELSPEAGARLATIGSHADHLHLDGLTVEEVATLLARRRTPAVARAMAPTLHRRTAGHPLFVSELALLPAFGTDEPLPTVVTGVVARRLAMLPGETRAVLDAASVLGNRLLPDVLGRVRRTAPGTVVAELGPAIDVGLVRSGPGEELWFVHDLFRETLYRSLDATSRSRLHARIGGALEARHASGAAVEAGDLARHLALGVRSAEPEAAVGWARQAAHEERQRSAFTEAVGHLRRARSALADAGHRVAPELLVALLLEEADSQARSGDPDGARALLAEAARSTKEPEQQADVALAEQRLGARFTMTRDDIVGRLEQALDAVTGRDPAREAQLAAALARELQHSVAADRRRAEPLSERALVLGRGSDDARTLIACLLARHDTLWTPGTGSERAELGREITAVARLLGDTDREAEGLLLEANGRLEAGDAGFRPILRRWFDLLETRDEPRDRYLLATRRAALALLAGEVDRAEALIERAVELGERIHEPDVGNVRMSQRVALAHARADPDALRGLADEAIGWWVGAPILAHGVAAGAYAVAGDLEAAERQVATVAAAGGWRREDSYLRSVLLAHLAEAATATGDVDLCRDLLAGLADIDDACGVNGAVVAFAGPFAHSAGILSDALGERAAALEHLDRSITTARRLGAEVWVERGEARRGAILARGTHPAGGDGDAAESGSASLTRRGSVWTAAWREERGSLPHSKGLTDIAVLLLRPGREVPALELAGGASVPSGHDRVVDLEALRAYRARLDELVTEIEQADRHADLSRREHLTSERDEVLLELRRVTGLGGRARTGANDPGERARKAVSARIRDAIKRLDAVTPLLAQHLDRSIRTGLRCSYDPAVGEAAIRWRVDA